MTKTVEILAAGQPALRIYDSALRTDAATSLPVRWGAPVQFSRLRKAVAAPGLAGVHNSVSPGRLTRDAAFPLRLASPPSPARSVAGLAYGLDCGPVRARFFFCSRRRDTYRPGRNVRGLRLVWLLGVNQSIRRWA